MYTNIYLTEYLKIRNLNLKNDFNNLEIGEFIKYMDSNGLLNKDSKFLYDNFISDKEIVEMNVTEKLISMQYVLENYKITKKQLSNLIKSF